MLPVTNTPEPVNASLSMTGVFISAMTGEQAHARFPVITGLPARSQVFVVVSETGQALLVADTRAEATRQVARSSRYVLWTCH